MTGKFDLFATFSMNFQSNVALFLSLFQPARIRKPNRLIFGDEDDNRYSPVKSRKPNKIPPPVCIFNV